VTELVDLAAAGTPLVSDILGALGLRARPLDRLRSVGAQAACIAGPAVTIRYAPVADGRPFAQAPVLAGEVIEAAEPGSVLVVAAAGADYAFWGDHLSHQAAVAGLAGAVVDGKIRDAVGIVDVGFPVFALAQRTPETYLGRYEGVACNETVQCAGAEIAPGDFIVADGDGVLTFASRALPAVRRGLAAMADLDEWMTQAAAHGLRPRQIYGEIDRRRTALRDG
jgi:4-hydroxy-4-methyl-2-oxoglutarate aldolase